MTADRVRQMNEEDFDSLEVSTNINNERKRADDIKKHNAKMMAEALGRADV
jgi:hypothetical protein